MLRVLKRRLICILLFCAALPSLAQESIDLVTLSGRFGLPNAYDDFPNEDAVETSILFNAKLPIVLNEESIWYNNLTYTHSAVSNDLELPDSLANPIGLNGFILQTGLVQRFNEHNAIQLLFVPRYMSDLEQGGGQPWQFGAIALYERVFGPKLTMRYGAMYNDEKSGALIVPLIDVNWKISKKWSVTGLLPIYGKINYKINEDATAGFSLFGLITSYDLTNPAYANNYMERTSIDLTLFARHRLFDNFFAEARVGYALGRTYAQYDDEDQIDLRISLFKIGDTRKDPVNYSFSDGMIASMRLVYNLPLD